MTVLVPKTEKELAALVASHAGPFDIRGAGSRRGLGRPASGAATVLNMSGFSGITLYEPEELILEAGAGTPLATIQAQLRKRRQMLAFEPPELAHLWGGKGSGTLGGLIACGLAGPRRIQTGSVRDHVLGFTAVSGRGEIFKAGARVVKNVTGYDLPKLVTGSHGTLVALTSIIMKVLPAPETEETLLLPGTEAAEASALMTTALQSAAEVSGAAFVPGQGVGLRLEGIAASVAARRALLAGLLGRKFTGLEAAESRKHWQMIRDCRVFTHDATRALWRVSLPPSDGAGFAMRVSGMLEGRYYLDWGGGLVWLDVPIGYDAGAAVIRGALAGNGHATLLKAPAGMRARIAVFQPQAPALEALSARIKAAFDPQAKFNPGRMWAGT